MAESSPKIVESGAIRGHEDLAIDALFCAAALAIGFDWGDRLGIRLLLGFRVTNADGIVSVITTPRIWPGANYLILGLGFLIAALLAAAYFRFGWRRRWVGAASWVSRHLAPLSVLALCLWVAFRATPDLDAPVDSDLFHQGEFLGFRPAWETGHGSPRAYFLIHGFAPNVLPSVLGGPYGPSNHSIVLARAVRVVESVLAVLGLFWLLVEIARVSNFSRERPFAAALVGLVLMMVWDLVSGTSGLAPGWREVAFFPSLAWLVRTLGPIRSERRIGSSAQLARWAGVGAWLTIGLVSNYERSSAFALVTAGALALTLGSFARHGLLALLGVAIGAGLGAVAIDMAFGSGAVAEFFGQVRYWARHGDAMWMHVIDHDRSNLFFICDALPTFLIFVFLVHRRERRSSGLTRLVCWVMVLAQLASFKRVSRPDHVPLVHLTTAVLIFAFVHLLADGRERVSAWRDRFAKFWRGPVGATFATTALCWGFTLAEPLDPFYVRDRYFAAWRRDESFVSVPTREVLDRLKARLGSGDTFFTLTSEGVWYFLLDRPAPGRHHVLHYAKPEAAQNEIIAGLEARRPRVILAPRGFPNNETRDLGGAPERDAYRILYAYVDRNYEEVEVVGKYSLLAPR